MSKTKRDQCEVFGCTNFCEIKNGRNAKANNIFVCAKHRTRWNRHKSFDIVKNERNKEFPTYSAAHKRIYVKRGLAKHNDCVDCGDTAAQWALVHTAKSLTTKDPCGLKCCDPAHGKWITSQCQVSCNAQRYRQRTFYHGRRNCD
jgi:hypothetical protein